MNNATEEKITKNKKVKPLKKPKGWIRWSGLVVFLGVIGSISAIGYLSFSLILKNQLENFATDAWGAKVELGGLDIGLFPIRVGLLDLAVTDPEKPMENLFQVKKIGASLSFYHLVVGRTVIEELAIEDLAFNQAREVSGEIIKEPGAEQAEKEKLEQESKNSSTEDGLSVPSMAIPNLEEVLAREDLQTFVVAQKVQDQITQLDQQWQKLEKDLPVKQDLDSYQQKFNKLINSEVNNLDDIQRKQKELASLQKEVKTKLKSMQEAKDMLAQKLPELQTNVADLKKLPAKDLARLQSKYGLNQQGLSNISYLLYGDKIQGYVSQAQYWYNKAKPFIDKYRAQQKDNEQQEEIKRATGVDVKFTEYDPEPDFIIKKIVLSSLIPWGDLALNVTDLNFDQVNSKMPIKFIANLQPTGQTGKLNITGESNFIVVDKGFHLANITMDNYQINDWLLSDKKELPVLMKQANNQVRGKITLLENQKISGKVKLFYKKVDFDLSKTSSKNIKRYIAPVFDDINQFIVVTNIKGKLFAPKIGINSDLDKKLSTALNKVLNKEVKLAKAKLKQEFNAKVAKQLEPINSKLSSLLGKQTSVDKSYKGLQEILAKKPSAYADEQKKKLRKKTDEKVDKEKQKLRKETDDKVNKEKEKQRKKLEDKFKKMF